MATTPPTTTTATAATTNNIIEAQIKNAAATNAELLTILNNTEHAEPTLKEHVRLIAELEKQIKEMEKKKAHLVSGKACAKIVHESYSNSHFRRFFYKVANKGEQYKEKASAEEQRYFAALQRLHQTEKASDVLIEQLSNAKEIKPALEDAVKKNKNAEANLDILYNSIFGGPTPAFPEEDNAELGCAEAGKRFREAKAKEQAEQSAFVLLQQANRDMGVAFQEIAKALSYSRADMFGGGRWADAMERNHLSKADHMLMRVHITVARAQSASEAVGVLPEAHIDHGSLISDVFFDNIFSDMAFHNKIKDSRARMQNMDLILKDILSQSKIRLTSLKSESELAAQDLSRARQALQAARASVFDKVLRQSGEASLEAFAGHIVDINEEGSVRLDEDLPSYTP